MSMSRKGLNIYKRKDGRWEARYIKSRTAQGKPLYGYLYASSYHEARNRLQDVIRLQGNAPNSKEMCKGSVFEFFSIEWLDTFSTNFKESTYIRYRTLIKCYLMPYFQTAKIENITKEHVLDFCKEIETHGKRDGTALSTKTVSDILSVLRRILHYAKAQNILFFRNLHRKCQHDAPGKLGVPLVLHGFHGVPEGCPVCISGRRMGRQHDLGVDKLFLLVVEFRFLVVLAEQPFAALVSGPGNSGLPLAALNDGNFEMRTRNRHHPQTKRPSSKIALDERSDSKLYHSVHI